MLRSQVGESTSNIPLASPFGIIILPDEDSEHRVIAMRPGNADYGNRSLEGSDDALIGKIVYYQSTTTNPFNEAVAHLQDPERIKNLLLGLINRNSLPDDTSLYEQRTNEQQTPLLEELENLKNTPEHERWPDATWPTDEAFHEAAFFIRQLSPESIPLPDMGLADDGEINFLWDYDGVHIDLGFYGTGVYSYFAQGKSGEKIYKDDLPVFGNFPSEIVALFLD